MTQSLFIPPINVPFLDAQGYVRREWYTAITRSFGTAQGTADEGLVTAQGAQETATTADGKATVAQDGVDALAPGQYVVIAADPATPNARVLAGDTGLTIDTATPNMVQLVLDVIAALGYTPVDPNVAVALTAGLTVTGLTTTDSLRVNQAVTVAATAQVGYVTFDLNGVATKVLTG